MPVSCPCCMILSYFHYHMSYFHDRYCRFDLRHHLHCVFIINHHHRHYSYHYCIGIRHHLQLAHLRHHVCYCLHLFFHIFYLLILHNRHRLIRFHHCHYVWSVQHSPHLICLQVCHLHRHHFRFFVIYCIIILYSYFFLYLSPKESSLPSSESSSLFDLSALLFFYGSLTSSGDGYSTFSHPMR